MSESTTPRRIARVAAAASLAALSVLLQGNVGLRSNLDERLLASHNRERSAAGIAPLRWDPALAADAARWASALAASDSFEHSDDEDGEPQGENLFMGSTGDYAPEAMVGAWIEEKQNFRAGVFPNNSATGAMEDVGHYTQLMWRNTGQIGCALAPGEDMEFLVCRYSHAGNVEGERPF